MIHRHNFGKWGTPIDGYGKVYQFRVCKSCGEINYRTICELTLVHSSEVKSSLKGVEETE
jgi:hypothetical protein